MLVGYVSDEDYVALPGVELDFENESGFVTACSTITGAVHAEIAPGRYRVSLGKAGYGSKRVDVEVATEKPHQFRLISNRMYGFMWPKCVRAGEKSEYCVHSTEQFKLDLWRYGWEKEFVRSLGWCDEHGPRAMMQITPDGDYTQTGVAWNREGYSLQFQKHAVTAPEKSGLYYLHAKTRAGDFCNFPWIVSPREPQADVAVLTSNITWNAYNKFGGRSNYFNQDSLPPRPVVNARQDIGRYTSPDTWPFEETAAPLSFQRPEIPSEIAESTEITDPIPGRTGSCFAPGEWRLLGWLEREGFEYDLYSEVELHFDRIPLEQYRVLVLNNHHEYWSKEMYFRVKKWVHEQGGRLMYLGGCGMYAEVEFPDEATALCRREGVWDQRGEPAAKLLGVEYSHSGFQSGAPYRVIDADHWAFAGTGLKAGDRFGQRSLHERCPGGASAHELDKISSDGPHNMIHLAKGDNPDDSGADLITYETATGGAVFAVGSLCWTLSVVIDEHVSAITANALKRFLL
jgi:hypothetical protein